MSNIHADQVIKALAKLKEIDERNNPIYDEISNGLKYVENSLKEMKTLFDFELTIDDCTLIWNRAERRLNYMDNSTDGSVPLLEVSMQKRLFIYKYGIHHFLEEMIKHEENK